MAGHSKWANIRHKKSKEDAKRGKAFTKLIKEITVAAREGGGQIIGNPRLRTLTDKAKGINMPLENVTRAIKKGTGELPGVSYEALQYEGYGPNGIAVIVDTLTDNKNRTVADLRHLFNSKGGSLSEAGSVSWMFDNKGVVHITENTMSEDDMLEKLLDFDVDDVNVDNSFASVYCNPKSLDIIRKAILELGLKVESAQLEWVPKDTTDLPTDQTDKAYDFLSALDDHDDVQNVYTNLA